ncbi:MAG TPA: ATP-binding cassette domain-containing protein [Candidatus Limnocylindria bacterium]|nr:ATP-binding cassette domain-containing protein [Candidatus Limnocylindria bacterium]
MRGARVALGGRTILEDIDLDVAPGLTLLRGPNGAGKTTLLRALAGLVPLSAGDRTCDGALLVLGHRPQLLRGLTARENLSFFARYRGDPAPRVELALAAWGVPAGELPVERLSAGQRRRAALARLDAERWDVALLDEPFAELDEDASHALAVRLATLGAGGRAILVATHGHTELDGSRTVRLAEGRLA